MNKVMVLIYKSFGDQPDRYYRNNRCIRIHSTTVHNLFFEPLIPSMTCIYYDSEYKVLKRKPNG